MGLKGAVLCPVCTVFDEATGHCRPKDIDRFSIKYPWVDFPKYRSGRCDSGCRTFYRFLKFKFCSHGRSL